MSKVVVTEGCAKMPPGVLKKEAPYLAVQVLFGNKIETNFMGKKDVVGISLGWGKGWRPIHVDDWAVVSAAVDRIKNEMPALQSPEVVLELHRRASRIVDELVGEAKSRDIIMMKDSHGGSGWWRMVLPAQAMGRGDSIDVTAAGVPYDSLLEYKTIYVQRVHDWETYYVLKRLKEAGRRIVYDLDDDLFRIPISNPAFHVIGRDQQMAARECMRLADAVTCTTEIMKERVVLEGIDGDKVRVVPNSLDVNDRWLPTDLTGSPDDKLRIFWQGGATHAQDWMECIGAIDRVMRQEPRVILMILGSLPPVVREMATTRPYWRGRVQYLEFGNVESYYEMIHHVRADVGIAPLEATDFNGAKSPIKWLEFALIGMPTVASNVSPYREVIEDGKNGRLVSSEDEWVEAILGYLQDSSLRRETVRQARMDASKFDLNKTVLAWEEVLG